MFSGKDAANPAYPTQWALNPNAYQNVDSSQVDWAALAQQWIAMKEAAAIVAAPQPPSMKADEEGEAPMEVENPDHTEGPPADWNSSSNSWGGNNWNQWGWGWSGSGSVDPKMAGDPSMGMGPMMDGYQVSSDNAAAMPGYTTGTVPAPTFQHGYWTAPQAETNSRGSSRSRDRRSKSRNRDHKSSRSSRSQRLHHSKLENKAPALPTVIEPVALPPAPATIDAAKRRQLPAWIREGLEKMEREKQRAIEREQEKKAREEAEKEKKRLEEEELARLKAEAGGAPVPPPKSKFESDSEPEEESEKEEKPAPSPPSQEAEDEKEVVEEKEEPPPPPLVKRSKEEIMQEVMLTVRRSLTEILLEVTDQEIQTVSQEELARYTAAQASRLNAMKASKSKALAAIATGLGLGAYESSSGSDDDDATDITDQQLQDMIKRRRSEFERTSREIEADVRRAELREELTPERPRPPPTSVTPPPPDSETPEKLPERRMSKDKKSTKPDKADGVRKMDAITEEKTKKSSRRDGTPSPQKGRNHRGSGSSDSEDDSSSSSSRSSSASEERPEARPKKRKRRSSSSETPKKSKREKHKKEKSHRSDDKYSKSKHEDRKSRHRDDHYRHKRDYERSERSERSHKDKYRESSSSERAHHRARRERSASRARRERARHRR